MEYEIKYVFRCNTRNVFGVEINILVAKVFGEWPSTVGIAIGSRSMRMAAHWAISVALRVANSTTVVVSTLALVVAPMFDVPIAMAVVVQWAVLLLLLLWPPIAQTVHVALRLTRCLARRWHQGRRRRRRSSCRCFFLDHRRVGAPGACRPQFVEHATPISVLLQCVGIAGNDQQGLGAREQYVEALRWKYNLKKERRFIISYTHILHSANIYIYLRIAQKSDAVLLAARRADQDDWLLFALEFLHRGHKNCVQPQFGQLLL